MSNGERQTRREFLRVLGGAAFGVALSACGGAAAPGGSAPASRASAGSVSPSSSGAGAALKVAYVTTGGTHAPLWIAEEIGAFQKYGLKVSDQFIQGDIATKAMIAKEVDVILQSAAPVITADLNGNAGIVFIGSVLNHSQFALLVHPSIKSAADLKGKAWGTDKPGTTGDYQTKLLLKLLGLQASDVVIRELGGNDIPLKALLSGQVQAAPMIPPFTFQGVAQGYAILKDTYDQAYQNVGAVVGKARIPEMRPALVSFLAGYRDGIQAFNAQPDVAINVLRQYTKETDETLLKQTYDFYKSQAPFQADLQPTLPGIQNMLEFLGTSIPAAKGSKPEEFVDTSLLAEMPKS
ncbi:MAG TPA: ABC transporter substrate-binding protein [Chloroflexota bacterium]